MAHRSLRGMSIGSRSMESEHGVEYAERITVYFDCPNGHEFAIPFAGDAEVPANWECRCSSIALRRNVEVPDEKPAKPARTHWDMLLERRSVEELEALLAERLDLLRSGKLRRTA